MNQRVAVYAVDPSFIQFEKDEMIRILNIMISHLEANTESEVQVLEFRDDGVGVREFTWVDFLKTINCNCDSGTVTQ